MAKKIVERLEQALRIWEQTLELANIMYHGLLHFEKNNNFMQKPKLPDNLSGAVANYEEIRNHLLEIRSYEEFDIERFGDTKGTGVFAEGLSGSEMFLKKVAAWTTQSRRVYHLNEDLALTLMATSFGDMTCEEIPWPFDSFAISLEKALPTGETKKNAPLQSDFALISRPSFAPFGFDGANEKTLTQYIQGENTGFDIQNIQLVLLNADLARWKPIDVGVLSSLKNFRRHQYATWSKRMKETFDLVSTAGARSPLMSHDGPTMIYRDIRIEEALHGSSCDEAKMWWRIAVGLCFYLAALPTSSPHRGEWVRTPKKPKIMDLSAVTETSEICMVSSRKVLTPREREVITDHYIKRKGGYEIGVHFREGHWRRPWGKGHDPNEPKSVEIPFTIVNRIRLPEGAIPRGSENT